MKEIEIYCKYCGKKLERKRFNKRLEDFGVFKNRKYCNRNCMRMAMLKIGNHNQTYRDAHQTAVNIMNAQGKDKKCLICGSTKNVDVHHNDGDYTNNNLENLIHLCRSCHMKSHRPKQKCKICGEPMKGKGYCNKHYIRFIKYGDPLKTKYKNIK